MLCEQILRAKDADEAPIVLVANKCDLMADRVVDETQGRELAGEYNAVYLETSAKTGHNIELSFHSLVREVRRLKETEGGNSGADSSKESGKGKKEGGKKRKKGKSGLCTVM